MSVIIISTIWGVMWMSAPQTTGMESLYRKLNNLPDSETKQVVKFIESLEGHIPNEETAMAIGESLVAENIVECTDIQDMFQKCGVR
jgi:hypothetical protein